MMDEKQTGSGSGSGSGSDAAAERLEATRLKRDTVRRGALNRPHGAAHKGGWLKLRPYSLGALEDARAMGCDLFVVDEAPKTVVRDGKVVLKATHSEIMDQVAAMAWALAEPEEVVLDCIEAGPDGRPASDAGPAQMGWKRATRLFKNRLTISDWKWLLVEMEKLRDECEAAMFDWQDKE